MEWSGVEDIASPDPGGGGAAGLRAGSTGSPTARGGGTPTTPAAALQPASLQMMWKHQTSRRMEACLPCPREKEGNLTTTRNTDTDLLVSHRVLC